MGRECGSTGKTTDYVESGFREGRSDFQFAEETANPAEPAGGKRNGLRLPTIISPDFADRRPMGDGQCAATH